MVGWPHQFNGHELGQTPGDGEGQEGLACCSLRDRRVRYDLETEQPQSLALLQGIRDSIGTPCGCLY